MIRVGLLGCGNVGSILASQRPAVDFVALYDKRLERAQRLCVPLDAKACETLDELLACDVDLIVEAASIVALQDHGEAILSTGKDLVVLSVGALADKAFREQLMTVAQRVGRHIRIPSGALFGLDNIKIGRVSRLEKLVLRTTKPPRSLGMDVSMRALLFEGSATECIQRYPKNVNVAVALSLAAGRDVTMELWVDPDRRHRQHTRAAHAWRIR